MGNTFQVKICSPLGVCYEGEAISLTVPLDKGPLCIEYGYTNLIGALQKAGVMKLVTPKETKYYAVFGGVVDIQRLSCTYVYTEDINEGYAIDMARAIAARDRSLDRINNPGPDIDVSRAKAKLAKALIRINVKELSEGIKR